MLRQTDKEIWDLCHREKRRQFETLELIASENYASQSVLEAMSSCFHNKYSDGTIGARYYVGNELVDAMESVCQRRALTLFNLDPEEWGVNVQPYGGTPANFQVLTALAGCHGRVMGLAAADGGHRTHGFQRAYSNKPVATSLYFESLPFRVDPVSGLVDYDQLGVMASLFQPKVIVAGTSGHSRALDYSRFRAIADSVSAVLMADMAHVSGLVAAGLHPSPFPWCDVVTTTTHKTLCGPRGAMIFYRKLRRQKLLLTMQNGFHNGTEHTNDVQSEYSKAVDLSTDYETHINEAITPGIQGGPHNHVICSLAVALKEAASATFREYQRQVLANMQQLCSSLLDYGYQIVSGGSDTHLCVVDLRTFSKGEALRDGDLAEKVLNMVGITVNKNTCPGETSIARPGGIRIGTPALTRRGLKESEMVEVASLMHRGLQLAMEVKRVAGPGTKTSVSKLISDNQQVNTALKNLATDVRQLAARFPPPGMPDF